MTMEGMCSNRLLMAVVTCRREWVCCMCMAMAVAMSVGRREDTLYVCVCVCRRGGGWCLIQWEVLVRSVCSGVEVHDAMEYIVRRSWLY